MKILKTYLIPRFILDFITFYPVLMILGPLAAGLVLDGTLLLGMLINFFMLVFAFLINDVEDRDDDAKDEYRGLSIKEHVLLNLGTVTQEELAKDTDTDRSFKRFKNPFAESKRNRLVGYISLFLLVMISLLLSYTISLSVFLVALSNIFVGILYSWKKLRLKSLPLLDVLSHAYLLATVQILYFLAYPRAVFTETSVLILIGVTLFSIGGDLSNEVRDYASDREAKLHNTASLLKERNAKIVAVLCNFLGIGIVALGIILLLA